MARRTHEQVVGRGLRGVRDRRCGARTVSSRVEDGWCLLARLEPLGRLGGDVLDRVDLAVLERRRRAPPPSVTIMRKVIGVDAGDLAAAGEAAHPVGGTRRPAV